MLLLAHLLSLSLSSTPPEVSLQLVAIRPGVQPEHASRALLDVQARLARAGLAPRVAPPCGSRSRQCLTSSAVGKAAAIGVDVGQLKQQLVIRVEALDERGADVVEAFEVTTLAAELNAALDGLDPMMRQLGARFVRLDAPLTTDAVTVLEVPPPSPARSRTPAWLSLGGAAATAGGSIVCLAFSLAANGVIGRSLFTDAEGLRHSSLAQSELSRLRTESTAFAIGAIGLGVVSIALGALSGWLFLAD